jgi:hypothetical protein
MTDAHPIDAFLSECARAGLDGGTASRLRVFQALGLPGAWTRQRLRAVLRALLAAHPEDCGRFDRVFDRFFTPDQADATTVHEQDVAVDDLGAWLAAARLLRPSVPMQDHPPAPSVRPPTRRSSWWRVVLPACLFAVVVGGRLVMALVGTVSTTEPRPELSAQTLPPKVPPDPTVPIPKDVLAPYRITRPALRWVVSELPLKWDQESVVVPGVLLAAALAASMLLERRWRRRHRLPPKRPISLTPGATELTLRDEPAKPFTSLELDRIANRTGMMPDSGARRLAVRATVRATARRSGLLALVYHHPRRTRSVRVVQPAGRSADPHTEAALECLITGLRVRGVPVERTVGRPWQPGDDLVLLIADMSREAGGPLASWLNAPSAALIEGRDRAMWGPEVVDSSHRVYTLDADGIYAAVEAACTGRPGPLVEAAPALDAYLAESIDELGDALPLAAACSALFVTPLGLADRLRRTLTPLPYIAFQRVARLRGVTRTASGWRVAPTIAAELQSRAGAAFMTLVFDHLGVYLAEHSAPEGTRAEQMLVRERSMVAAGRALLAGRAGKKGADADLRAAVTRLQSQRGEAVLERRAQERLRALPPEWLEADGLGRVPPDLKWQIVLQQAWPKLPPWAGPDPRRRTLWLQRGRLLVASVLAAIVAAGFAASPQSELDTRGSGALDIVDLTRPEPPTANAPDAGFVKHSVRYLSANAVIHGLDSSETYSAFREDGPPAIGPSLSSPGPKLVRLELGSFQPPEGHEWLCTGRPFEPGTGGPNRRVSIVSLPDDSSSQDDALRLLREGIANCVSRDARASLPDFADEFVQILTIGPGEPAPRLEGKGHYWRREGSVNALSTENSFWVPQEPIVPEPPPVSRDAGPPDNGSAEGGSNIIKELLPLGVACSSTGTGYSCKVTGPIEMRAAALLSDLPGSLSLTGCSAYPNLAKLPSVTELNISDCQLESLSSVRGTRLTSLIARNTKISSASGLPELDMFRTPLADISPLRGLHLQWLDLGFTNVSDISSLTGMALVSLWLGSTPVKDLSPLRGMPIQRLNLDNDYEVKDISALSGMPLKDLSLREVPITSLAPIAGAPIRKLNLQKTPVADLSPLKGMPLESLDLSSTHVTDLSPLVGAPLRSLCVDGLQVDPSQLDRWRDIPCGQAPIGKPDIIGSQAAPPPAAKPAVPHVFSGEGMVDAAVPRFPSDAGPVTTAPRSAISEPAINRQHL